MPDAKYGPVRTADETVTANPEHRTVALDETGRSGIEDRA
jgi:hypothetical protein